MIPEIGQFALANALVVVIIQTILPLLGAQLNYPALMRLTRPAVYVQSLFIFVAYVCLSYAFASDDFSVKYVALNSNTKLPLYYKLSAVWGAHEGSLLLWVAVLSGWTMAVSCLSKSLPQRFFARVIGVMGFINTGFLLFIITVSNPFERLFPTPVEGQDLNPLLQDPGLVIHPPLLYFGYVGFAVAFAFAIAALLGGRLDSVWARWTRPWTLMSWVFLTAGITLGSWWAYHELGWGGWWFWDPVENASFMPWLVGTALIHSLIISEKRDTFKSWTILLAILAFSLSLLGTFLVRSGVLVSVHAFASDPERGVFILAFLSIVVGLSLSLYAWRAPAIRSRGIFSLWSRESALLMNNILLLVSAFSILIATLYPLLMDALALNKISVGAPYFNAVFVPLALPLAVLAGIGPLLQWKTSHKRTLLMAAKLVLPPALAAAVLIPLWLYGTLTPMVVTSITAGIWVLLVSVGNCCAHTFKGKGFHPLSASFYGMTLAHIGIGVFVIGVTFTGAYSSEKSLLMADGEVVSFEGYKFTFKGIESVAGPNYSAARGHIEVSSNEQIIAELYPEKRVYPTTTNPMTEAAIAVNFVRDLYVSLGEVSDGKWGIRIYYRPLIRWIWWGALLMVVGGLVAVSDRRYRVSTKTNKSLDTEPLT